MPAIGHAVISDLILDLISAAEAIYIETPALLRMTSWGAGYIKTPHVIFKAVMQFFYLYVEALLCREDIIETIGISSPACDSGPKKSFCKIKISAPADLTFFVFHR